MQPELALIIKKARLESRAFFCPAAVPVKEASGAAAVTGQQSKSHQDIRPVWADHLKP